MESQVGCPKSYAMELRKVLKFNGSFGFTLPRTFSRALDVHWKDYVEIYFVDPDKIVVKKHKEPPKENLTNV